MGDILIGTSGFSFDDWVGEVYPAHIKKHEMLPYYEKIFRFRTLEVNYTYYSMPSKKTMESFLMRTSEDFSFAVKAHKSMTHERTASIKDQCRLFKDGVSPLGDSLKALLFQFPYTFIPDSKNIDYLKTLRQEFEDYESVVEFRNAKWSDDGYLDILRELDLGYCIVDEPRLKGLLPFRPALTSDTGYFRFHGRNTAWFKEPVNIRYDYLYSEKELEKFVDQIKDIAKKAGNTFVFFNNCHMGKAVRNAQMLKEMLSNKQ
jgi:uncharacterized protein YecE (DUF72 family)